MKDIPITDAELEVMKILWDAPEGLTTGEVKNRLDRGWERTTVLTLLTRLCEKGAVSAEKASRSFLYKSLIKKEEYGLMKTQSLLNSMYNGSIKNMMAALCDAQGLTKDELLELRKLLDGEAQ
jgi:predicted transcriptional regulator